MTEFSSTDVVLQTGEYLCTSCGDTTEFETGDDFSVCGSCGNENAAWTISLEEEGSAAKASDGDAEEGLTE